MEVKRSLSPCASTTSKILSLRMDRPVVWPGLKYIPGLGTVMTANTSSMNDCPGGCRYCFCSLSKKNDDLESTRTCLSERGMIHVIRAVNIVKPAVITTSEKVELGFCPEAVEELKQLRAGVDSSIRIIFTTKFPSIYKKLDIPNTSMLVTLSNPRNIPGIEPNIPSLSKRVFGVHEAATKSERLKVGVRILIFQKEDIRPLADMLKTLKPYLDPNLIWVDFLREPFRAKAERFENALKGYVDLQQFAQHNCHRQSLKTNIIVEAMRIFSPYGATFDRLPVDIRKDLLPTGIRIIDNYGRTKCYIRPDGVECLHGSSCWQGVICSGRYVGKKFNEKNNVKKNRIGSFCKNLAHMSLEQYSQTHNFWHWIGDVKAFAFGDRKKNGADTFIAVMKTLHDPELLASIKKHANQKEGATCNMSSE